MVWEMHDKCNDKFCYTPVNDVISSGRFRVFHSVVCVIFVEYLCNSIRPNLRRVLEKNGPFVISSYMYHCFDSYELHENFQKYIGGDDFDYARHLFRILTKSRCKKKILRLHW